jgi:type I restriction enzyme S subunit
MASEWKFECVSSVANVTDFVANGSFESLRNNVTYRSEPDHAVLVRLVDHNAGWKGDFVYVDKASFDFLKKSVLFPGDIVIANVGANAGTVFRVPALTKPMTLGPNAVLCRPLQETLDRNFLYYYLTGRNGQDSIASILGGSAQPKFNKTDFRSLQVPVPPLAEQKAIASILGALDDKIELNRRMNATLEGMARVLFQSWFVDFDPVRAKLDGRKPEGMDKATASLFPDAFQDSSIGAVPKGWKVKALGEVIELAYGKPLKAEDRKGGPVCVYGANGPVGWHDEKLVTGPGIVVGRKGNPGVVTWAHSDFYPIDTTFYVEPRGECHSLNFLYYALSLHNLANLSADSAVPGLNRNHAYMSKQIIPSQPVLIVFDSQITPVFSAIHTNEEESRTLANLRDTLLPKLLSGELSVASIPKVKA